MLHVYQVSEKESIGSKCENWELISLTRCSRNNSAFFPRNETLLPPRCKIRFVSPTHTKFDCGYVHRFDNKRGAPDPKVSLKFINAPGEEQRSTKYRRMGLHVNRNLHHRNSTTAKLYTSATTTRYTYQCIIAL